MFLQSRLVCVLKAECMSDRIQHHRANLHRSWPYSYSHLTRTVLKGEAALVHSKAASRAKRKQKQTYRLQQEP